MTVLFEERPDSREGTTSPPSEVRRYFCSGVSDSLSVRAIAIGATPSIIAATGGFLYRGDIRVSPEATDHWEVEIPYTPPEQNKPPGSWRLSFDTTGGTFHIDTSLATVAKFPNDATDFKQLINVEGATVHGTDIVIPALKITVNFKHPMGVISLPHIKNLARYTGRMNNAQFLTFAAKEVLFLGATGAEGSDTETEVAYQFAMSENVTGLSIGDIAGIAKAGHDIYWVAHENAVDGNDKPGRKPKAIYVEKVYQEVNLASVLGFGGF